MSEEDFFYEAYSSVSRIIVYEQADIWLRMQGIWVGSDSKDGASGQPLINPDLDWIPIANLPFVTMLDYPLSNHDTSPSIWRFWPHFSAKEVILRNVPSFEDPVDKKEGVFL